MLASLALASLSDLLASELVLSLSLSLSLSTLSRYYLLVLIPILAIRPSSCSIPSLV
jgi:hypothetical protein